jgi:FkbM family methyltransferase
MEAMGKWSLNMHHKVFSNFQCWEGEVEAGFAPNFLGVMTRVSFFPQIMKQHKEKRFLVTSYPGFDEEYFQWIDLLEAVTTARDQFVMIELGAGWGRWLVNAAVALQYIYGAVPYKLIGVEAEPTHFRWMHKHFHDNDIDPDRHQLIQAAVADKDGSVWFLHGNPAGCYGQRIVPAVRLLPRRIREFLRDRRSETVLQTKKVEAISLNTIMRPLKEVDLIDLDVQGAEFLVLNAAVNQLDQKVKMIHIGTHSPKIENDLRTLFSGLGWINANDYSSGSETQTRWGTITFQDGVQTWINPKLSNQHNTRTM